MSTPDPKVSLNLRTSTVELLLSAASACAEDPYEPERYRIGFEIAAKELRDEVLRVTDPNRCPRCNHRIDPGTVHRPFNGNQMFACQAEGVNS